MIKRFFLIFVFIICTVSYSFPYGGEYWIKIQNSEKGKISVSKNEGDNWKTIGHVIVPIDNNITEPDKPGFTAADYGMDSSVVATAVNALHIRISKPGQFARIFSLLPEECCNMSEDYKSYKGSAIITDINGEKGIFGKEYAPYIGNMVYLLKDGSMDLLPPDYVPQIGDEVVIKVIPPNIDKPIKYITIENKINGYVMIVYEDLSVNFVARVLKPVAGIGGFTGTSLAGSNRIRANHPGVLCISTSKHFKNLSPDLNPPKGGQTGFQLIPYEHTLEYVSAESNYEGFFGYARLSPVYLILMPRDMIFIEDERFSSEDKDGILAARDAMLKKRETDPLIGTDPAAVIGKYLEIKDRDYSSVFGRVYSFKKDERLYGEGFFFGGYFKAGTCDLSIKRTGEDEFSPIPEYNNGKDLTVFEDVEEIKIYYVGY